MKTAGQDFLKWYNDYVNQYGCSPSGYDVNFYWTSSNLEKEKQQIIEAVQQGLWNNEVVDMANYSKIYYDSTFGDNHEAGI